MPPHTLNENGHVCYRFKGNAKVFSAEYERCVPLDQGTSRVQFS